MGGYIGARAGSLSTTTVANVQDVTATDTTPEVTIINNTHEDTDGGREGKVIFKGQQSGGEESTLAEIEANHSGSSDDEKGQLVFRTNDGSDGTSPTQRMKIDSVGTVTITNASNDSQLILESTDADADSGPVLELFRNSASPADDDLVGAIEFHGENDADEKIQYGLIAAKLQDASDGTEDVRLSFKTITAGTERERITIQPTEVVINEDSQDLDFRVESNGDANCLFVDGANDKIGIGTAAPLRQLHIHNTSANSEIAFTAATNGVSSILFGDGQTGTDVYRGYLQYNHSDEVMLFGVGAAERMRLDNSQNLLIGKTSSSFSVDGLVLSGTGNSSFVKTSDAVIFCNRRGTDGTIISLYKADVNVGSISVTGSATAYNTSSDYRLKENVADITDGITRVKQLAPKRFNFIADADTTVDGFLAHEAQAVVAEAVHGTKDELEVWAEGEELPDGVSVGDNKLDDDGNTIPVMQGIDQAKLVPLLTAALQEAIAKIETLETKVAALEG